MAAINPTITDVSAHGRTNAYLVVWSGVTEADTCVPVLMPQNAAKSVQVTGTFGSASVALDGSNDGANYYALNDLAGSAIAITDAGLSPVQDQVAYYQPSASNGTAQTLSISMLFAG